MFGLETLDANKLAQLGSNFINADHDQTMILRCLRDFVSHDISLLDFKASHLALTTTQSRMSLFAESPELICTVNDYNMLSPFVSEGGPILD